MTFSSLLKPPSNIYTLRSSIIERSPFFKYLGVIFTSDLSWNMHIEHITNKALKKLGFLKRRLHLANSDTRLRAYISIIRATLDYASVIWHPHTTSLTDCIESIQNKAARFILRTYSPYQSVSALKQSLNLPDLSTRRKFFRLSLFHSLYYCNSPFSTTQIIPAHYVSTRNDHTRKVAPIFARTKKKSKFPSGIVHTGVESSSRYCVSHQNFSPICVGCVFIQCHFCQPFDFLYLFFCCCFEQ